MPLPDRAALRRDLAHLDPVQRKLALGVLAIMFQRPERVREREWIVEQFTQVTLLAAEDGDLGAALAAAEHAHDGLEIVQRYVRANIDAVLNACYAVFVHVGEDLRGAPGERSAAEAMLRALAHFEPEG